jgi:hypothetical protein
METVDHMRNLVLAAAYLAYRRTGSYQEAAHLLGLPPSRSDIYDWLVRCVTPSDQVVRARYPDAQALIETEIVTVLCRMSKLL